MTRNTLYCAADGNDDDDNDEYAIKIFTTCVNSEAYKNV